MEVNNILVGIDFDINNAQLIKLSFELSKQLEAKLFFLHCYHPSPDDIDKEQNDIDRKHLQDLIKLIDPIGNIYTEVDYVFDVTSNFVVEGMVDYITENEVGLVLIGKKKNQSWIPSKSTSISISERIEIPMLIVPEDFRFLDCNHIIFNFEFQFREIEKLYDLLLFCNQLNAILTCVHVADKSDLLSARQNMNVYNNLFEGHILQDVVKFELLEKENGREIEFYAKDNEADIIVLSKTRRTWQNQYLKSKEETLSRQISIPIMLLNF